MKYTISVTISRRGISDVMANMLLNTDTSTMIGIALRAMASGLSMSLSRRKRIRRKLTATPSTVPTTSPARALRPETNAASRTSSMLSTNADQMLDGLGRKYGFQSKTSAASSQSVEEGDAEHDRRPHGPERAPQP